MNNIWQNTLFKSRLVSLKRDWGTTAHSCKVAGMLIRWEIHINPLPYFLCNLDSRNHVAICRDYNSNVAVPFVGINNYLCSNSNIRFFFFMCSDFISAFSTDNTLFQIRAKEEYKL